MNSESKHCPRDENSRRDFFHQVGALAAASSVAAKMRARSSRAGPGGRGPRANPAVKQPGPLSKQPMPTVKFGQHEIGRLIMGVNGPGAHFSVKEGMDARAWLTPERIAEENRHMVELGINCMEAGSPLCPVRRGSTAAR